MFFRGIEQVIDIIGQIRTDGDDSFAFFQAGILKPSKDSDQQFGFGKFKIGELLGEARMHVVYQLKVEKRLEKTTEKDSFFMGVDNIVSLAQQQPYSVDDEKTIKKEFEQ